MLLSKKPGLIAAALLLTGGAYPVSAAALARDAKPITASGSDLAEALLTSDAQRVAQWIRQSSDNDGLPFMIVDKISARLFLFTADGVLRATTSVLLGLARGDDSPPNIGTRRLSAITPAERITPAGRFVLERGEDLVGRDILWIDYDAAVALHRASDRKPNSGGRSRVDRLSSATVAAKRISLGCINVSSAFYDRVIQPTFSQTAGIAYILPETRSITAQFNIPANPAKQIASRL